MDKEAMVKQVMEIGSRFPIPLKSPISVFPVNKIKVPEIKNKPDFMMAWVKM